MAAKQKEVAQRIRNKVIALAAYKGVARERIMRCRWILTWKKVPEDVTKRTSTDQLIANEDIRPEMADLGDGTMAKARWVVLGYEDPDLGTYATYAPTIRHDSNSWLMILCCHRGCRLRSLDARTAFLAGRASRRARSVDVLPPDGVVEYLVRIYGEKARGPLELLKAAYVWVKHHWHGMRNCGTSY